MSLPWSEEHVPGSAYDLLGDLESPFLDAEGLASEEEIGRRVQFPSGESLAVTSGPDGPGQEFFDPNRSGNPLLDVSGGNRKKKLSASFSADELAQAGGTRFLKARIDPALVECLQRLRVFLKRAVSVVEGYYSYRYLMARLKRAGVKDTSLFLKNPHLSGRGVKIQADGLSGLELAKAIILSCPDAKAGAGSRTATLYVKPDNTGPTSYITDRDKREEAIITLRVFRDLCFNMPDDIADGLKHMPGKSIPRGTLGLQEAARRFVHWAVHQRQVRDAGLLTEVLFYRTRYLDVVRDGGGRYNPRSEEDRGFWKQLRDTFVLPALGKVPPVEQTGGVPKSTRGERDLAPPAPDHPPADITGRYEAEMSSSRMFLGATLVINQAGNHVEAVLSGVLKPGQSATDRALIRYNGDVQPDGSFQLFSRTQPDVSRRLFPQGQHLVSEYRSAGATVRQVFTRRSGQPVLMEQALAGFGKGRDRVRRHEWFPLLSKQINNLHRFFSDSDTIGRYLRKFFLIKTSPFDQRFKEFRQGEAAVEFEKTVRKVIEDPDTGIHRADFVSARTTVRLLLSANLWRPEDSDPLLPQIDWIQRMVSIVEYNFRTERMRSGGFSASSLPIIVDLLGLVVGPVGSDGVLHTYTLTLKLSGFTALWGAFFGSLTVRKVGGWKETFKCVFVAVSAGGGLKVGAEFTGTLTHPINLLPRDFSGTAELWLGGVTVAVPGLGEASGVGGSLYINGTIPIRVEFLDSDVTLKLQGNAKSKKRKPKITISGELTAAVGWIRSKKTTIKIEMPKTTLETDYTVIYNMTRDVHFGFNSAFLTPAARQALRIMCAHELPALMSPTSALNITAHTDRVGKEQDNLTLSTLRAANTQQGIEDILGAKLAIAGGPGGRIKASGRGETEARDAGDRDGTRNLDRRRVDVTLNGRLVLRLRG